MNYRKYHCDPLRVNQQRMKISSGERKARRRGQFDGWIVYLFLAVLLVGNAPVPAYGQGMIHLDAERKLVTLADGQGQLALRLNFNGRCVLDQVVVRGREVAAESGVASGLRV